MQIRSFYKCCLIQIMLLFPTIGISQTILPTNSSPLGFAVVPIGWTVIIGSTDISNKDFWGGISPWFEVTIDPPNGHEVWVTGAVAESVGSTISGLIIGESYIMSFYKSELRYSVVPEGDGVLEVVVGVEEFLFPFSGGYDPSWSLETFIFTATDVIMDISFNYTVAGASGYAWNISFSDDAVELECDSLDTDVSATEICFGEEVTLSAESINDGLVTWDGGITDGVAFAPPLGITTYVATSDVEDDCVFEVEITVFEYPEFEVSVDVDEICEGDSVIFSVDGDTVIFEWDTPGIVIGEPYLPGIGEFEYFITGSNGVCETVESIEITVYENPIVEATVSEDEICMGESVVFTGVGSDTYTWDLGVSDGEEFTPVTSGTLTYTVIAVDAVSGCESLDSVDLTVYELPTVEANADDDEVCEGDLVTLTGIGAVSFVWDMGVIDGVAFEPPLGTTTYSVIGTSFVGCENTAAIDISVNSNPEVIAMASATEVCEGDDIVLTGLGADTYVWDFGVVDGEVFVAGIPGTITYTLIGTNGFGCEGTASIEIIVNPMPAVIAIASPMEICAGESIVFTGSGADIYSWDGGITDGLAFIPAETGELEFTVTGTNLETGCINTNSVIVSVYEHPTVIISATATELCLGEFTNITASGAEIYVWDFGVINGVDFYPPLIGTTTYTVIGTDENGCKDTADITVNVLDCEPIVVGFILPNDACLNDCFSIQDTSADAVVGWEWDFGLGFEPSTSNLQNPVICATTPGVFTITLTGISATGSASTHSEEIIIHDNPMVEASSDTIIELGGSAILIANSSSTGEFIWTPFDQINCSECEITIASPNQTQTYTVELVDMNGCKSVDSVIVMVNYLLNIGVPTAFSPNGDGNNDVLFVQGLGLNSIQFLVYNRYGERIFETNDQDFGWDGTFLNQDQNPGVFTWVLFYNTEDGKSGKLKGNTTLIR
ncbi:MAG: gliding motility-associated-like protein [Crocinitomix sp.]|jgi:gliding motility-associated-like protein